MAQSRDKEETEFKVPETITLCINNCGFSGNPATKNMCQSCFKASSSSSTTAILTPKITFSTQEKQHRSSSSVVVVGHLPIGIRRDLTTTTTTHDKKKPQEEEEIDDKNPSSVVVRQQGVNRCSGCRRKVGLTGFRCRCGDLFCSEHRYSDRHDCSFDYKAAGRETIARENPVVKAAKILRI